MLNKKKITREKICPPPPAPSPVPRPAPPPPHTKIKIETTGHIYMPRALGTTQVSVRLTPVPDSFNSSTSTMGVASQNPTLPYAKHFHSFVASPFFWRCLTASAPSFPHAAINLHPRPLTVSTYTSASNAVCFQSPTMTHAQMSLCTQSVHSFSFTLRPVRTAPSRFPNTVRFGSHPQLIRRSGPTHKRRLVCKVASMLSHRVIYWHGCTRSSDGLVSNVVPQ